MMIGENRAFKQSLLVAALAFGCISSSSAQQYQFPDHASALLRMPTGCYPVSFNAATEKIGTVCKGQENWDPTALQYFNSIHTGYYLNRLGTGRSLKQDLAENVGPGPWMAFYLSEMDRLNLPRPK